MAADVDKMLPTIPSDEISSPPSFSTRSFFRLVTFIWIFAIFRGINNSHFASDLEEVSIEQDRRPLFNANNAQIDKISKYFKNNEPPEAELFAQIKQQEQEYIEREELKEERLQLGKSNKKDHSAVNAFYVRKKQKDGTESYNLVESGSLVKLKKLKHDRSGGEKKFQREAKEKKEREKKEKLKKKELEKLKKEQKTNGENPDMTSAASTAVSPPTLSQSDSSEKDAVDKFTASNSTDDSKADDPKLVSNTTENAENTLPSQKSEKVDSSNSEKLVKKPKTTKTRKDKPSKSPKDKSPVSWKVDGANNYSFLEAVQLLQMWSIVKVLGDDYYQLYDARTALMQSNPALAIFEKVKDRDNIAKAIEVYDAFCESPFNYKSDDIFTNVCVADFEGALVRREIRDSSKAASKKSKIRKLAEDDDVQQLTATKNETLIQNEAISSEEEDTDIEKDTEGENNSIVKQVSESDSTTNNEDIETPKKEVVGPPRAASPNKVPESLRKDPKVVKRQKELAERSIQELREKNLAITDIEKVFPFSIGSRYEFQEDYERIFTERVDKPVDIKSVRKMLIKAKERAKIFKIVQSDLKMTENINGTENIVVVVPAIAGGISTTGTATTTIPQKEDVSFKPESESDKIENQPFCKHQVRIGTMLSFLAHWKTQKDLVGVDTNDIKSLIGTDFKKEQDQKSSAVNFNSIDGSRTGTNTLTTGQVSGVNRNQQFSASAVLRTYEKDTCDKIAKVRINKDVQYQKAKNPTKNKMLGKRGKILVYIHGPCLKSVFYIEK